MQFKTLQQAMIAAMKAREKERKEAISVLVSAAKKLAIDEGCRDDIPEELVDRAILKEIKSVKEQIDTCPADRTDLKDEYTFTLSVMEEYAPKQLSEDEIRAIIIDKFTDVIATGNKGQIMKAVMGELKGKADGKVINQVVTNLCKQKNRRIIYESTNRTNGLEQLGLLRCRCHGGYCPCQRSLYGRASQAVRLGIYYRGYPVGRANGTEP